MSAFAKLLWNGALILRYAFFSFFSEQLSGPARWWITKLKLLLGALARLSTR